jgi:hypothetical protein
MNLEKHERICTEFDKIIENLEKEINFVCKTNRNLKIQLEELEKDELLTMAWISAYPKD